MSLIRCWITREPEGYYGNIYKLHLETEPKLAAHDLEWTNDETPYWRSDAWKEIPPSDSYLLNPGECMELVLVRKAHYEELKRHAINNTLTDQEIEELNQCQ